MACKVRGLLLATLWTAVLAKAPVASGQQDLPPAPVPVVQSGPQMEGTVIAPPLIPAQPAPSNLAPLPSVPPHALGSGSPPILMPPPPPEPLPAPPPGHWGNGPNGPPFGWFASVEVDVVGPHVSNRLIEDVPFANGLFDTVHLPMASLDWTGSPRFEAGYRFANNGGKFSVVYRFLTTQGHATFANLDPGALTTLKSRLDFNVVDLAYGGGLIGPGPYSDVQYSIGVRMAQAFFDSRAENPFRELRTSNYFFGAGPLGAIEWWRRLDLPGLAIYGRLEGAVPIGSIHQGFEEVFRLSRTTNFGGALSQRATQAVPTLSFDLGLGWTPQWSHFARFSFGYHLERWWELGDVNDSSADLTTQGLFFKGEFSF